MENEFVTQCKTIAKLRSTWSFSLRMKIFLYIIPLKRNLYPFIFGLLCAIKLFGRISIQESYSSANFQGLKYQSLMYEHISENLFIAPLPLHNLFDRI